MLDTGGYDIILRMTWLSKYHVVVDCRNQKVIFRIQHQLEFRFRGECRSMEQGNWRDCAIVEARKKRTPVWDEFLEVFEESPGLPPDRVIEFSIDVIPGTTPISKAQYKMALIELAILRNSCKSIWIKVWSDSALHHVEHQCYWQIRRTVVRGYVSTIGNWIRSPSRTSILYRDLMTFLINFTEPEYSEAESSIRISPVESEERRHPEDDI